MPGTAVQFGAGNIGRGFIAELLHESGYFVVFIDVVDGLIDKINATKSYEILEVRDGPAKSRTITNYRGINSMYNMEKVVSTIADADIVTCAVGPSVLKFIAKPIADGLSKRASTKPVAVIACENMINATDNLKGFITDEKGMSTEAVKDLLSKAEFGNCTVDRIVPTQPAGSGLNIVIESFYEWCVDTTCFKSERPDIKGIHWVNDLEPYVERKFFTVNTGHAIAAYFGYYKGIKTIHESMANPEIKKAVCDALKETAFLVTIKHKISREEQERYVQNVVTRISNPYLEDTTVRVGRAPLRKLSCKERFIAPASQLAELGYEVTALLRGVEMALRFQSVEGDEESKELAKIMIEKSCGDATTILTGLEKHHPLYPKVVETVKKVQRGQ